MDFDDNSTDNNKRRAEENHDTNIFGRSKKVFGTSCKMGTRRDKVKLDTIFI